VRGAFISTRFGCTAFISLFGEWRARYVVEIRIVGVTLCLIYLARFNGGVHSAFGIRVLSFWVIVLFDLFRVVNGRCFVLLRSKSWVSLVTLCCC
jgi:hypothetical protein